MRPKGVALGPLGYAARRLPMVSGLADRLWSMDCSGRIGAMRATLRVRMNAIPQIRSAPSTSQRHPEQEDHQRIAHDCRRDFLSGDHPRRYFGKTRAGPGR